MKKHLKAYAEVASHSGSLLDFQFRGLQNQRHKQTF